MTDKLDIFRVLDKFCNHDVEFFEQLTDEQNKQIHPFVLQRWLTGTPNDFQVQLINEHSNMRVFNTSHSHRLLAWYVLLASTIPGKQRYSWKKTLPKKVSKQPLSSKVLEDTYNYSPQQASEAIPLLTVDDLYEMAEDLGWQDTELQLLRKEHHKPKK